MKTIFSIQHLRLVASSCLIALTLLCVTWEWWLAPIRPQGSLLILKALPLLLPLFGILQGKRYTYQWASMFILFYFIEGSVRAWSDEGLASTLAILETCLSVLFFFSAIYYAKLTRPSLLAKYIDQTN